MTNNFYVLEVRDSIILYLNERTQAREGWHWGSDDRFVGGPFGSYQLAVKDARWHSDKTLNLISWNVNKLRRRR